MDAQKIGALGEEFAVRFLLKRGFRVIEQNWRRVYGEIDIIAIKDDVLSFCEVKTVIRHPTSSYRPEERVDKRKKKRLSRAVMSYLHSVGAPDKRWKFYIISVYIVEESREAHVSFFEEVL